LDILSLSKSGVPVIAPPTPKKPPINQNLRPLEGNWSRQIQEFIHEKIYWKHQVPACLKEILDPTNPDGTHPSMRIDWQQLVAAVPWHQHNARPIIDLQSVQTAMGGMNRFNNLARAYMSQSTWLNSHGFSHNGGQSGWEVNLTELNQWTWESNLPELRLAEIPDDLVVLVEPPTQPAVIVRTSTLFSDCYILDYPFVVILHVG
jgi:hypothetical protein